MYLVVKAVISTFYFVVVKIIRVYDWKNIPAWLKKYFIFMEIFLRLRRRLVVSFVIQADNLLSPLIAVRKDKFSLKIWMEFYIQTFWFILGIEYKKPSEYLQNNRL